jgi:hypothetical protein
LIFPNKQTVKIKAITKNPLLLLPADNSGSRSVEFAIEKQQVDKRVFSCHFQPVPITCKTVPTD